MFNISTYFGPAVIIIIQKKHMVLHDNAPMLVYHRAVPHPL